jgi:DNA-binding transcriptional MerR regulator
LIYAEKEAFMLRSEIAKHVGIDSETVRFYEAESLISKPKRLDNGYRSYSKENLVELKFIQHCRSLGIGLDEIKVLKDIKGQSIDCSQANEIIQKNIDLIEQKMKELKNLRTQLKALSESCFSPGAASDCAIVKSLTSAAEGEDCTCHPAKG